MFPQWHSNFHILHPRVKCTQYIAIMLRFARSFLEKTECIAQQFIEQPTELRIQIDLISHIYFMWKWKLTLYIWCIVSYGVWNLRSWRDLSKNFSYSTNNKKGNVFSVSALLQFLNVERLTCDLDGFSEGVWLFCVDARHNDVLCSRCTERNWGVLTWDFWDVMRFLRRFSNWNLWL